MDNSRDEVPEADRQARIQWLKRQAAELGLNLTKGNSIDLACFDRQAFEQLFEEYNERDVRIIATMRKGRLQSVRIARVVNETQESRKRRSDAAKARWASTGSRPEKQLLIK